MGPPVTDGHRQKVSQYIQSGVQAGASLPVDGRANEMNENGNGFYLGATLFDRVLPEMKIYQEEIFGPVLGSVRVPDQQSALALINDHEYGNGTAIFTRDGGTDAEFGHADNETGTDKLIIAVGR